MSQHPESHIGDVVGQDKIGRDKVLGDKYETTVHNYNYAAAGSRPIPRRIPAPPTTYTERPEVEAQLRQLLINPTGTVAIRAAVQGAGGFGKTTLAQKVCNEPAIRTAYPDGSLWVTIGEAPQSVPELVADLINDLTGIRPALRTIDEAAIELDTVLGDRRCLLVIDDVWNAEHARPFLHGGPHCTRLITTRMADAVPRDAANIALDVMEPGESLTMLTAGLPVTPTTKPRLAVLAKRLGYWPLLISLAHGVLVDLVRSMNLSAALGEIEKTLDQGNITVFDATHQASRDRAVAKTLELSINLLQRDQQRYLMLAIFPEDLAIPCATLTRLWRNNSPNWTDDDTAELCLRFARLNLVKTYDEQAKTVLLHDVVRRYLEGRAAPDMETWHGMIVHSYRPTLPQQEQQSPWGALPAFDSYPWQFLAYHLEAAKRLDELVEAVQDVRYLLGKMEIRGLAETERDLRAALAFVPNHPIIRELERTIRLYSHLLAAADDQNDRVATLLARFQQTPTLSLQTRVLQTNVVHPYITPLHSLPDTPHPALVRTFADHTDSINSVAVSADGRLAVSGSDDRTVRVWDLHSGALLHTCEGHTGPITSVAVSADGRLAVSGSRDGTVRVWSLTTGRCLARFRTSAPIADCALVPDNSTIVAGDSVGRMYFLRFVEA